MMDPVKSMMFAAYAAETEAAVQAAQTHWHVTTTQRLPLITGAVFIQKKANNVLVSWL